jgi:DNA-binding transcriptional LysR family regulator
VPTPRALAIRANDAIVSMLTAGLVRSIKAVAPAVTLRFAPEGAEDLGPLRDGLIDLDLGVIGDLGPEVRTQPLYQEHLVGLAAAGHRLTAGPVTLDRLAAADHIAVSRRGRPRGALDDILTTRGLTRNVVAVVPTFTSAAHIIAGSDLTGLIPARYARQVAASTGAHCYEIPVTLPTLTMALAWHVRHDLDPAHHWLRTQIAAALSQLLHPGRYMRSGRGTPSRPRPVVSTWSTTAHRARRDCRISSSSALRTGHCS